MHLHRDFQELQVVQTVGLVLIMLTMVDLTLVQAVWLECPHQVARDTLLNVVEPFQTDSHTDLPKMELVNNVVLVPFSLLRLINAVMALYVPMEVANPNIHRTPPSTPGTHYFFLFYFPMYKAAY